MNDFDSLWFSGSVVCVTREVADNHGISEDKRIPYIENPMTPLRAKRILSQMCEYGTFDVDRIKSLPPFYVDLTTKGGNIACSVNTHLLRAIVMWMDNSEAIVNA